MPAFPTPSRRPDEELLHELLSRWQQVHERGHDAPAAALCRDRPDLIPELERRIRALADQGQPVRPVGDPAGEPAADLPGVPWSGATPAASAPDEATGDAPPGGPPTAALYPFLAPAQQPGELGRLGPYRVLGLLGAGGMGLVFRAEDRQLGRTVALKVMKPQLAADGTARQRFLREARAAAAVRHDHVVTIYQVGEDRGVPYLATELLEGQTLEQRLRQPDPLPVAEALRVGRELAEGLAVAHGRGLIHRDIKPGNIWLEAGGRRPADGAASGAAGRVKILDFGLARLADGQEGLTQTGQALGTPGYMAPEQATGGEVDRRTDLFSLGCVLYRMLTGRRPFPGRNVLEVLRSQAVDEPTPPRQLNPDVPPALAGLTLRLLAKDPRDRPPSADAVAEELAALERAGAGEPQARPARRRRRPLAFAAGLLVITLGAAGVLLGPSVYRFTTDQGEVVIETDDPDVEVTVRGPDIRILDTRTNRAVTLRAGKYQVELSRGKEGLRLSAREFTLERAGRQIVKVTLPEPAAPKGDGGLAGPPAGQERTVVPARWKPGAAHADLPGLAARPARIPGVHRWQVSRLAPGGALAAMAWSPDSRWLVCGGIEPYLRIYERSTGRLVKVLVGHGQLGVLSVAWSPDGKQIASGGWDDTIRLWDAEGGGCQRVIRPGWGNIRSVAWSPDGRLLAAAGSTGKVGTWQAADWSPGPLLKGHEPRGEGHSVCWSPDGTRIAFGGAGGLRLWDAASGKPDQDFRPGGWKWLSRVAWSPDDRWIASFGADDSAALRVELWDAKTGKAGPSFATDSHATPVVWSPDGKRLVIGKQHDVMIWDGATESSPRLLTSLYLPFALCWSPDGRWIALGSADRGLRLWDVTEGKPGPALEGPGAAFRSVSWSADGVRLASGDSGGGVRIWDGESGEAGPVHEERGWVESVAWNPDCQQLAFIGPETDLHLWPGTREVPPTRFRKDVKGLGVVWSPNGKRLAVLGQLTDLWGVDDQHLEVTLKTHTEGVAWKPDGSQVAAADFDSGVQLWNATNGSAGQVLKDIAGRIKVAWNRDGTRLASIGYGGLRIWDMTRSTSIPGPDEGRAVAWSAREDAVAYGSFGGIVGICDASGKVKHLFWAHHDVVCSLCWDPDGRRVASCSADGTLRAWDTARGQPLWQVVLLPGARTATFGPAGELLRADAGAEKHLVYLVERVPGKVDLLTAEEFRHLLTQNPPELLEPPVQEGKKPAAAEPFVVLARRDRPEWRFAGLAGAVAAARSGDTIEVRGDGPFVCAPLDLQDKALSIRSGKGNRPVLELDGNVRLPDSQSLFTTRASLVLEGLDIRRDDRKRKEDPHYVFLIVSREASLRLANCRFIIQAPAQYSSFVVGASSSTVIDARNCLFVTNVGSTLNWVAPTGGRAALHNSLVASIHWLSLHVREDLTGLGLQLSRNTLLVNNPYSIHLERQEQEATPAAEHSLISLGSTENALDTGGKWRELLEFHDHGTKRPSGAQAEGWLRRRVAWRERHNVYTPGAPGIVPYHKATGYLEPTRPRNGLADWEQFWGLRETGSVEGRLRYAGGDLHARRVSEPGSLTPEDFRLRPDSAGYRAGPGGRDAGADVDLVGPGAAYERWKTTPAYQEWLKATGQTK